MKKFLLFFAALSFQAHALHWVALDAPNVLVRSQIAQVIHIDSIVDDRVYAVVGDASFAELKSALSRAYLKAIRLSNPAR